ncbi:diguanylate cyclase (GGDEF)-like protein/PAS domain S-box-containing protein [Vogesella perlucida]|nr:diguanylate cyclase (GGDEF)-like protein/PAS domain S-box-containing protein [Vogesella perlucida]
MLSTACHGQTQLDATLLPCPVLVTDRHGTLLAINHQALQLAGGDETDWLQQPMERLFPLPSRIFLQTHVWPMLWRDGAVFEIRLQLANPDGPPLPVLVNCQRHPDAQQHCYYWVLFVTHQRTRYEAELLAARHQADELAARYARGEHFLREITDAVPALIAYWDRSLHCRFSNSQYQAWFGRDAASMPGIAMSALLGETLFDLSRPHIAAVLTGETQEFERQLAMPDGSVVHTLTQYVPDHNDSGGIDGFYAVTTNVTRIKEADAAIQLSAGVFGAVSEAILVLDADARLLSANPAFSRLSGHDAASVSGLLPHFLHDDAGDMLPWPALLAQTDWHGDVWCRRQDGSDCPVSLSLSRIGDSAPHCLRYVAVFSDISQRLQREAEIRHQALHDGLTGVANRRLMMERLQHWLALSARQPQRIAVLFMDLDGFKAVNDAFGHEMGDWVLQTVARRLQGLLRAADTVARLGGDEFVIVLQQTDHPEAVSTVAERIMTALAEPICHQGVSVRVGVSIGIALHPQHGNQPAQLLTLADQAMYQAKRQGKHRYCLASPATPV